MKAINLIFLFFFLNINAQNNSPKLHLVNEDNTMNLNETVDFPPEFEKCKNSDDKMKCFFNEINLHIMENFKYPPEALDKAIQGKIITTIDIDENGKFIIYSSVGPHKILEDEAKRIYNKLPKIKPALKNGIPVKVRIAVPLTFKLS